MPAPPIPPFPHAGELAALGTAGCWVLTALSFEAAGKRIGSLTVNLLRLPMAIALGAGAGWFLRGQALPLDASGHAWLWLSISGLVGFTFGDLCLFRAFVVIGPRLSTLMMALAPPLTVVIGWWLLGEVLSPRNLLGMTLTVFGVGWAVLERRRSGTAEHATPAATRNIGWGVLLGLGGALGQAGGLVLSKLGMGEYDPFAATQIRVLAGTAGYLVLFTLLGRWGRVVYALGERRALGHTAIGAFFGPFLGVSLSLLAIRYTATGVAASLMATTPILIIPVVVLLGKERVGPGGWLGAGLAVLGVVLLFD
ncbi:MAG: DMT family transporter [Acidobacteriota bacterium]